MVNIAKKYLSPEQLVLNEICKTDNDGINRSQLESELNVPKNTLTRYLNSLERDGFIISKTYGRTKAFLPASRVVANRLVPAFEKLESAYHEVIKHLTEKKLKELEHRKS